MQVGHQLVLHMDASKFNNPKRSLTDTPPPATKEASQSKKTRIFLKNNNVEPLETLCEVHDTQCTRAGGSETPVLQTINARGEDIFSCPPDTDLVTQESTRRRTHESCTHYQSACDLQPDLVSSARPKLRDHVFVKTDVAQESFQSSLHKRSLRFLLCRDHRKCGHRRGSSYISGHGRN